MTRLPRRAPIINSDGTITILLTQGRTSIIDEADAELAMLNWSVQGNHYAGRRNGKGIQMLHTAILQRVLGRALVKGEEVDHWDRNPLNNRRDNLRLATRITNGYNTSRKYTTFAGLKGVVPTSYSKRNTRWQAAISIDRKKTKLGSFDTPLEAHRAYCIAALTHFGEFANFGDNSPFAGWTLEMFAAPAVQLELPFKEAA